jgi:RNA polymerase sigma-70 factor (ECF subfamily)
MNTDTGSDPQQLLRRAREGSSAALGQLLEACRGYLTLLARVQIGRRLRGKVDAADVVQDVFLEAHRIFAQFRGATGREFVGWLRQLLASQLAMLVRRYLGTQCRDVRLELRLSDELDRSSAMLDQGLVAPGSSPSRQAARHEEAVRLAAAMGKLPEAYREVLILRHLEGLTFPEVARRMSRTVPSVKNLWARSLALLRRTLGGAP